MGVPFHPLRRRDSHAFRHHRLLGERTRLMRTPGELEMIVKQVRDKVGGGPTGDCEYAAGMLQHLLPGGSRKAGPDHRFHHWYEYHDVVIDVTAGQFVRELNSETGVLSLAEVERAGLGRSLDSGLFTLAEHDLLMRMVSGKA